MIGRRVSRHRQKARSLLRTKIPLKTIAIAEWLQDKQILQGVCRYSSAVGNVCVRFAATGTGFDAS